MSLIVLYQVTNTFLRGLKSLRQGKKTSSVRTISGPRLGDLRPSEFDASEETPPTQEDTYYLSEASKKWLERLWQDRIRQWRNWTFYSILYMLRQAPMAVTIICAVNRCSTRGIRFSKAAGSVNPLSTNLIVYGINEDTGTWPRKVKVNKQKKIVICKDIYGPTV